MSRHTFLSYFLMVSSGIAAAVVCDICNGGLLQTDKLAGYSEDNSSYTCQVVQEQANGEGCDTLQAFWGRTCCKTHPESLANFSDANANASAVLAGLQLCFDEGVVGDQNLRSRLSNPECVKAWATLCAQDDILGAWMQERVQSTGFRLCNQVPAWARGESEVNGYQMWQWDSTFEMLDHAATLLDVPWFVRSDQVNDVCAQAFEANIVFMWLWGPYVIAFGGNVTSGTWPSEQAVYKGLHLRFYEQNIDGPALCELGADELAGFGVPFGTAKNWRNGMNDYLYSQVESPIGSGEFDPSSSEFRPVYPGQPADVSITMVLTDLYNVNELDFSFTIGFMIILSWEDDRISKRCVAVGAPGDNSLPSDLCNHFWQPQFAWTNVLQYDEGEFEVVEELGFYTEVGLGATRTSPDNQNANLAHSIGYRMQRVKGHFVTPMGFRYFPWDCQSLLVHVRATADDASIYRFVPSSAIGARLRNHIDGGSETASRISGWGIKSIDHREMLYTSKQVFDTIGNSTGEDNPLYRAIESTILFPTVMSSSIYQVAELNVPLYNNVSEAVFSISIKRESHSYIFNFAVLVALLLSISFSSFLLPNNDMSGRITLVLTVYLGVIFFQILIVESLPRTDSFTTMHMFMFLSSIFNGIIVLEHALVYALNAWVSERAAMIRHVRMLQRSSRVVRHAIRLQRAFRNYRIHVSHQKLIANSSKKIIAESAGASSASSRRQSPIRPPRALVEASGAAVDEVRVSGVTVDVGVAHQAVRRKASDRIARARAMPSPTQIRSSVYAQQLELRLAMAEKLSRRSYSERKKAFQRKVYDFAVVFLEDANRFFTIITMGAYFIGVFIVAFLDDGQGDAKCNDPWSTLVESGSEARRQ